MNTHPDVPTGYWEFIQNVGYREFVGLRFYEGVVTLGQLGLTEAPSDFLAFSGDMAGGFYGFVAGSYEVVALETTGWVLPAISTSQNSERPFVVAYQPLSRACETRCRSRRCRSRIARASRLAARLATK